MDVDKSGLVEFRALEAFGCFFDNYVSFGEGGINIEFWAE
jgi:hypothetical protein